MKYIILLGDGMADRPLEELKGKTPLEHANIPNMDTIARRGTVGLIDTIPPGFTPGSDVANLSVLGYDPALYHTGRAPLEAASMGIHLDADDVAFRCNLVTLGDGENPVMADFTAGHITSGEGQEIVQLLNEELGSKVCSFYPGVGYRHLMVRRKGPLSLRTVPPHDIVGLSIGDHLPQGDGADEITELMQRSRELLSRHPINRRRTAEGRAPANAIWLWGEGGAPVIEPLTARYGITGGVISAVDLLRGIGYYAGLEVLVVEGATGYTDTNYEGKAEKALEYLASHDFVFLHVEAPDEMGHEGNLEGKVKSLEDFDKKIVGPILREAGKFGDFRIAVLSDHPTPLSVKTHVSDPSPIAVYSSIASENLSNGTSFGETTAGRSGILISPGHRFMDTFILRWSEFVEEKRNAGSSHLR